MKNHYNTIIKYLKSLDLKVPEKFTEKGTMKLLGKYPKQIYKCVRNVIDGDDYVKLCKEIIKLLDVLPQKYTKMSTKQILKYRNKYSDLCELLKSLKEKKSGSRAPLVSKTVAPDSIPLSSPVTVKISVPKPVPVVPKLQLEKLTMEEVVIPRMIIVDEFSEKVEVGEEWHEIKEFSLELDNLDAKLDNTFMTVKSNLDDINTHMEGVISKFRV